MKKVISTAALAIIAAAPAMAGGLTVAPATPVVIAPAPMLSSDWTGGYVGVSAGGGQLSAVASNAGKENFTAFGIHGGYTYDMGRFIIGGELDIKKLNFDDGADISQDADVIQANLLARLGYDMGKFQPYVAAGASQIRVMDSSNEVTFDGFAAGLGIDYRMTDHIQLGGRYTHGTYDVPDFGSNRDLNADTIELRLDYAF